MFNFHLILDILLVLCILYLIANPIPLKFVLGSLIHVPQYEPVAKASTANGKIMNFEVDGFRTTIYDNGDPQCDNLVVFVQGGAFLITSINTTYGLLNSLNEALPDSTYDIVVFDYCVRFRYTIQNSVTHVYKVIRHCRLLKPYTRLHGIGMSAGSLICGAMQTCEQNTTLDKKMCVRLPNEHASYSFRCFVSLCGLLSTRFDNTYLDWLFRVYLTRGSAGTQYYSCYDLSPQLPVLIVSSESEFLALQSIRFVASQNCDSLIFPAKDSLPHTFPLFPNIEQTVRIVDRIKSFVLTHNK